MKTRTDEFTCQAVVVAETDLAVRVNATMGPWSALVWVPRSLLQADNEVNHEGDEGRLVVALWWAVQEGLQPGMLISKSLLAVRQTVDGILDVMESQASSLATGEVEAICECGRCEGNPIAWHEADALRMMAGMLRESCR